MPIPYQTTLEDTLTLLLNRPGGDWTKQLLPSIVRPYAVIDEARAISIRSTAGYEKLCYLEPVTDEAGKLNGLYRLWWLQDWRDHYANIQAAKARESQERVKRNELVESINTLATKFERKGMARQAAVDMATMILTEKE